MLSTLRMSVSCLLLMGTILLFPTPSMMIQATGTRGGEASSSSSSSFSHKVLLKGSSASSSSSIESPEAPHRLLKTKFGVGGGQGGRRHHGGMGLGSGSGGQEVPCESDKDCPFPYWQYCGQGICHRHGRCGDDLDCINPSNQYYRPGCLGHTSCTANGFCDKKCGTSPCEEEDEPPVNCYTSPCATMMSQECQDENPVWCVTQYCGSCTALYLDSSGSEVCTSPENNGSSGGPTTCESNKDCLQDEEYCNQGTCLPMGDCITDVDCLNPSNLYPVIECVGPLTCNDETGTCGRKCGLCSNGNLPVPCFDADPCQNIDDECLKESPVACVDDYCGGCIAVLFNDTGHQVCVSSTCSSDNDCESDEYCSDGTCRTNGECGDTIDCYNPSNDFFIEPYDDCFGPFICTDQGLCDTLCIGTECQYGSPVVDCVGPPCDYISEECLAESPVSCVNEYCGGCIAIRFDARGNQVCLPPPLSCSNDKDCPKDEYCSSGICRAMGQCDDVIDCFNPSNDITVIQSIQCVGPLTCSKEGLCGRDCSLNGSSCPDGTPNVSCFAPPCDSIISDECLAESPVSCVDDYCGGCNAIRFNAMGDQVCLPPPLSCGNDKDCPTDEYCSSGICRAMGQCDDVVDCFNPSNVYNIIQSIQCVGPLTCSKDGICGRECSLDQSPCPDGVPSVRCFAPPCDSIISDECLAESPVSCVDDYCGGCNAIRFDAMGSQVCTIKPPEPVLRSCQRNEDCHTDEYCSNGMCRIMGACGNHMDCMNPSNDYAADDCIGPMRCNDGGMCVRQCSTSSCPEGVPSASCVARPCDSFFISDECLAESPISCVDDYCGGCNAIRFDVMGNQVCNTNKPPPQPQLPSTSTNCQQDGDCEDDEYCSSNICRPNGACGNLMDCFNPSNEYKVIEDIGYLTCDEGICGKKSSTSSCSDGSVVFNCLVNPCQFPSEKCLAESPISCVADYCGGCNAYHFDAAGNSVC